MYLQLIANSCAMADCSRVTDRPTWALFHRAVVMATFWCQACNGRPDYSTVAFIWRAHTHQQKVEPMVQREKRQEAYFFYNQVSLRYQPSSKQNNTSSSSISEQISFSSSSIDMGSKPLAAILNLQSSALTNEKKSEFFNILFHARVEPLSTVATHLLGLADLKQHIGNFGVIEL